MASSSASSDRRFWQLPGLGIGPAWNEQESKGLCFEFPPVAERFRQL